MLNNYIVYLLIFLLLLLLISRLLDISIFKMLYPIRSKIQTITTKLQEGMECSQGEKDELYKQKIKISNLKKENATIKNKIRDLETTINENKKKNKENVESLKQVSDAAKGDVDKQQSKANNINF
jgi:cell shape-determining protein MreC